MAGPINPTEWAQFFVDIGSLWGTALHDPKSLLSFSPGNKQLVDAAAFYLEMLAIQLILTAPLILQHKGEFGDKARMVTTAVLSMVTLAVSCLACNLAFRLVGGSGNFISTFLAMAYGFSPYGPFMTLISLLMFAALPQRLRPYALSPATSKKAGEVAMGDPRTNKGLFILASVLLFAMLIFAFVVFLRCMIFVHRLHGVRAAVAVVVAFIVLAIVGKLITPIQGLIMPPPTEDIPDLASLPADPAG